MSRRTTTFVAFGVAVILTMIGMHYCWNRKWTPPVRMALWFPAPYFLGLNQMPGMLLSLVHFPLLAWIFALATRVWRARWVLAVFVAAFAVYETVVIVMLGPPQ